MVTRLLVRIRVGVDPNLILALRLFDLGEHLLVYLEDALHDLQKFVRETL